MQSSILRPTQTTIRKHKFNIKDRWDARSGMNLSSCKLLNQQKLERESTLSPNMQSQHKQNNVERGTALLVMKAVM